MKSKIDLVKVFKLALNDRKSNSFRISNSTSGLFFTVTINNQYPLTLNYAPSGKSFLLIGPITQYIDESTAEILVNLYDGITNRNSSGVEDYLLYKFGEEILLKEDNN